MDFLFKNIVNLSIGIYLQSMEDVKKHINIAEGEITKLISLGEKEKTEQILQIEELLKKIIRDSRKLEGVVQDRLTELGIKIQSDLALLSKNENELKNSSLRDSIKSGISEMQELAGKNSTKKSKKTKAA